MSQGVGLGPVDPEKFMESARSNTPWSLGLDQAIAERIREEYLVPQRRSKKFRRKAIKLVLSVRSFQLRDQIYKEVLAHFGIIRVGWYQRMKNNLALLKAYKAAEEIWTKEVIEDLRKAGGLLEYFIITEKAWEDHVKKRAVAKGIKTKSDAVKLLIALLEARKTVENPAAAEVAKIFPEGVRYRDSYLEDLAKSRQMDTEQLKMLEDYKSENTESPYHKVAKVMFEFLDEYVAKLKPEERAEIALYLAGYDQKLRPELHDWIHSRVLGTEHRRKSMKEKGFFFSLEEIRTFFQESHSEERMIAYRALFVGQGGISESSTAEDILIQRLLMADPGMPVYLHKVLTLYMRALNASERASLLSWILATNNRGILKGPDIVRLICEKGGVVVAKLAQIIASHGFNLPDEYRHVLEVFKGKAQQIDKAVADKWIRKRLSPEKYAEIKSLDEELGSGSYKIGYAATLVSGQRVVIKLGREYIQYRTAREFEILNHVVEGIMNDPDLRIANLPAIVDEVKRILQQELNMLHESSLMRDHQRAYDARSIWVKLIGQSVSVCFPQPLEGWEKETILVEELVEGRDWDSLPDRAWFGWSKATLARAAVTEILNQLLAFLNPEEHSAEGVLLDIDPHEKNQFARVGRNFSLRKTMVDIDLGESVHVAPEVVRRWVEILYAIDVGNSEAATTMLGDFLDYPDTVNEVWVSSVLSQKYKESSDPLEALTQTMETAELKGVILRSEYLFFQKLFATVVGLKRHIGEKDFIMSQARKILFARVLSQPQQVIPELISIRKSVRDPLCRSLLQDKKASGF